MKKARKVWQGKVIHSLKCFKNYFFHDNEPIFNFKTETFFHYDNTEYI